MAKSLNEFLQEYFKLVRMIEMRDNHTEQWAHFEDLITSGDMTKDQKKWADKLLQKVGDVFVRIPAPNGEYQIKALPNPSGPHDELNASDWEQLFRICQNVYARLSQDRASYTNNDKVIDFINEWQHLFIDTDSASVIATTATETQCGNLKNLLTTYRNFLKDKLETNPDWTGILDSSTKYDDLINGLDSKKYNKDDRFREKIQQLAGKINNACDPSTPGHKDFISHIGGTKPNLRLIYDVYAPGWTTPSIDPAKLTTFKEQYQSLFKTLYKEDKVLEAFKSKEGGDNRISVAVDGAKNGIDYDKTDSKNYVSPKRNDVLTPMQQLQKWATDTYENSLEKYVKLKGDRLFFSEWAKKIAKALDKNSVKPTDGIKGLCGKSSDIAKTLKSSPTASAHFDWMSKTLSEFLNDPNMKKTLEGALKNGRQMRNLISELIIKAVEDGKVTEAKTAMEVLSVMKYGATTSKTMDTLKKEEFTIFSDGKLSWNKNQSIQFVSKALDKSIKTAFMGIGYGITMIGNEIRLRGSKYNRQFQHGNKDKTGKKLRTLSTAHDINSSAEKAAFITSKTAADATDSAQKASQNIRRNTALGGLGIAPTAPDAKEQVNAQEQNIQNNLRPDLAMKQATLQPLQEELDIYDAIKVLLQTRDDYQAELATLNTDLSALLSAPPPRDLAQIRATQAQITLVAEDVRKNKQEINNYEGMYGLTGLETMPLTGPGSITEKITTFSAPGSAYDIARNAYDTAENDIISRESAIHEFRDAESEIKNLTDAMDKRNKKLAGWDKDHKNAYQELVAYWDMLETGRDSHTGKMYGKLAGFALGSKKAKQKAFDATKQSIIDSYWTLGSTYAA